MSNEDDRAEQPLNIGFQLDDDALDDYESAGAFAEAFCADIARFLQEQGVHIDVWQASAELVFGMFSFKFGPASVLMTLRRYEDAPDGEEWWLGLHLRPAFPAILPEHKGPLVVLYAKILGEIYADNRLGMIKATLPPGMTLHRGGNA